MAKKKSVQMLAAETLQLPTPDKLRLAAGLLEAGRHELGRVVAQRALDELELNKLMCSHNPGAWKP